MYGCVRTFVDERTMDVIRIKINPKAYHKKTFSIEEATVTILVDTGDPSMRCADGGDIEIRWDDDDRRRGRIITLPEQLPYYVLNQDYVIKGKGLYVDRSKRGDIVVYGSRCRR